MSEKADEINAGATTTGSDHKTGEVEDVAVYNNKDDDFEVFKKGVDGVEFRLVGWPRASIIFLKSTGNVRRSQEAQMLIWSSSLCHRCTIDSHCNVQLRIGRRRAVCDWLGCLEHL
jgi:hypothetical protein